MKRPSVQSAATVAPPFWPSSHLPVFVLPLSLPLLCYVKPTSFFSMVMVKHKSISIICLWFNELNDKHSVAEFILSYSGEQCWCHNGQSNLEKNGKEILKKKPILFLFCNEWFPHYALRLLVIMTLLKLLRHKRRTSLRGCFIYSSLTSEKITEETKVSPKFQVRPAA